MFHNSTLESKYKIFYKNKYSRLSQEVYILFDLSQQNMELVIPALLIYSTICVLRIEKVTVPSKVQAIPWAVPVKDGPHSQPLTSAKMRQLSDLRSQNTS